MNGKNHWIFYCSFICIFVLLNFLHILSIQTSSWIGFSLMFMFVINPDIDLLVDGAHRNFLTHSCLFPTAFYLAIRLNISCDDLNYAAFSLLFYAPVIFHLLGDLSIIKRSGFWLINFRPFSKRKLNFGWSTVWLLGNSIFMICFVIFQFIMEGI